MALDLIGKFVETLPLVTGTSARGPWSKQEFIIETVEQYPKKVCVSLWGDRIRDIEGIQVGETLTVSINLESREYNGRWFTEIRAWRVQRGTGTQQAGYTQTPPQTMPPADFGAPAGEDSFDDLPF